MKKLNRSKLNCIYEAAIALVNRKSKVIAKKIAKLARKAKEVCVGILSKRVPYPAHDIAFFCHHHSLPPCFFSRFSFGSLNVLRTIYTFTNKCVCLVCVVLLCSCKSAKTVEYNKSITSDVNMIQTTDHTTTTTHNRDISAIIDGLTLHNVVIRITDFKDDGQGMATAARITEITVDSVSAEKAQAMRSEDIKKTDTLEVNMALSGTMAAETTQKTEEQPKKVNGWRAAQIVCAIIIFVLVVVLMLRVWRLKGGFLTKILTKITKWFFFR